MSERSFDIAPGQDLIGVQLGFSPLSIVVDNLSTNWLYFRDAERFVAPYMAGVTIPLMHAMGAYAEWKNPAGSGVTTPIYAASGFAHILYTDQVLTYNPGSPVGLNQPIIKVISASNLAAGSQVITDTLVVGQVGRTFNLLGFDLAWVLAGTAFPTTQYVYCQIEDTGFQVYGMMSITDKQPSDHLSFQTPLQTTQGATLNAVLTVVGGVLNSSLRVCVRYFVT